MSSSGGLTSTPLRQDVNFNWVFLIELVVCGIVALFFLFYFNRVFATLVSYGIRAWTWHKYRVYIDIQSLQISLLAGRIFFRGIKYHGNNETILIHNGYVTWVYWVRNVRGLDLGGDHRPTPKKLSTESDHEESDGPDEGADEGEAGGFQRARNLPCRLQIYLKGVEWFVYNRSAAYDAVLDGLLREDKDVGRSAGIPEVGGDVESNLRQRGRPSAPVPLETSKDSVPSSPWTEKSNNGMHAESHKLRPSSTASQTDDGADAHPPSKNAEGTFFLRFLPIHVQCTKAAVVMGNENTKSVLIAKMESASGEIDASRSTGLDPYRQLINFQFEHPVVQMKPNDDYKEDQSAAASRLKGGEVNGPKAQGSHAHTHSFLHRQRRRVWHTLQDIVPAFRSSVESFSSSSGGSSGTVPLKAAGGHSWQGLSRYLDENEKDDRARWSAIEYATVTTIADCSSASMCFYWDVAGTVASRPRATAGYGREAVNINGDIPPEWGIKLLFKGSSINYGPWADRQRADIQRVFFPSLCKDAIPTRNLVSGQYRVPVEFKLYIEFDEETTLRIPIREESKNWKWTKQADTMDVKPGGSKKNNRNSRKRKAEKGIPGPEIRPFGWIDVKIGANATINYVMDMVAGTNGYSNSLELDLPSMEITTSVNHGLLWRSVDNRIACDLSNPLKWNSLRSWKFDIASTGLELFILREHVFLLVDLVEDWSSGPPSEYLTFCPFQYLVSLHLGDFRIYLNVNDANIINNPSDFDDNTYIIIFGAILDANICIPLMNYRPFRNDIPFSVKASNGGLNLHVPPWNTQATFLRTTEIATLKALSIDGTHQYCATTSSSNTDTLLLNVHGHAPSAQIYGFVIRYFLKVKDNYFGDDIRFKTLEEYQEILRSKTGDEAEHSAQQPPFKKSNDLDVILSVTADESSVILPSNLYSSKKHIRIEISTIAADLRFTNYYMDLDVVLSTLAFSQGSEEEGNITPISATSSTQLFVDGITASGNRLFGLPPAEPTYICNWDFAVGAVCGECTIDFFTRLASGARAFAFSFDDDENALPLIAEMVLHDVTFLRASVESVRVWLHVDETAFLLSTATISVGFNDWAGSHYSKKLNLNLPDLHVACVDAESASRHRSRNQHPVETHAFLQTSISFTMIQRVLGFHKDRQLQQEHVKRHDQRTHRADFLLRHDLLDDSMLMDVDPPAQCVPPLPSPVSSSQLDFDTVQSLNSVTGPEIRSLRHKSSFLSISASSLSDTSIVRPQSSLRKREVHNIPSRSRSLQTSTGPGRRIPLREASASTGRQSSFYSAVGEHRGLPPSTVTFSSSYIAPYFPLEGVEPDSKDLPGNSQFSDKYKKLDSDIGLQDVPQDRVAENSTHVSFILELPTGVRGVVNPKAVQAVSGLLSAIQAVEPDDLLDVLQIDSMNDIFDLRRLKLPKGQVIDFCIRTPAIDLRFLNSSSTTQRNKDQDTHDQYDISLAGIAVTLRTETAASSSQLDDRVRESSVVHASLDSAAISANERYCDVNDPQAAINGVVDDVVFWMVSGEETSSSLAFQGLEIATASNKIEYLASLLHRTEVLSSSLAETFSSRSKHQHNRVELFTFLVATAGQTVADPLFLTRPSYVLRSATDHLRTSDSWKLVTRLHHMFASLQPSSQRDIAMRCFDNAELVPPDARQRVHASFTTWRSWDLNDITGCLMMAKIFGTGLKPQTATLQANHFKFSLRTEGIRLVLDPGPKENEFLLSEVTAAIEISTSGTPKDIDPQAAEQLVHRTTVELFCSEASVNLNWELLELADDIIQLYHQSNVQTANSSLHDVIQDQSEPPANKRKKELHILLVTNKGSLTLDTINIRASSISKGLKASFIMVDHETEDNQNTISLMLAAEAATSTVKARSQELTIFQLRNPSIYTSYDTQLVSNSQINTWKLAGNCAELSFLVQQDILALVEVFDTIVGDEIAQIYRLQQRIPKATPKTSNHSHVSNSGPKTTTRTNVAFFLDQYHISVPLLQSLTYKVSGIVARASVAADLDSEIVFDFDIKEHSHDIQTVLSSRSKSISLLQMPPTNGRVTSSMSTEENVLVVFASIEPVELDAAAVHSLLTALNRPEISSVVTDIQEDAKAVQYHLEEIFGRTQPSGISPTAKRTLFVYEAHLTLAGFNVFANAQNGLTGRKSARLDFNLGCVELLIMNRPEHPGPIFDFPQIRMRLRQITFELSRWNDGVMEPCGNLVFGALLTASSKVNGDGDEVKSFHLKSDGLEINLFADTAPSVVDVIGHLQEKIKDIDLSREKQYLRRLRKTKPRISINNGESDFEKNTSGSTIMFASTYSLELLNVQVSWLVGTYETNRVLRPEKENLVLSLKRIDLSTRKENAARLTLEDLLLQMATTSQNVSQRSLNSALLPEVIFNVGYVSTADTRRLAFQAAGKSLDLRLTSQFMKGASELQKSVGSAVDKVRAATATWSIKTPGPPTESNRRQPFLGKKRMESLLVDADFAGAVVFFSGKQFAETNIGLGQQGMRFPQAGKYGQFTNTDTNSHTALRAPGLAWKVEYNDNGLDDPSLNAEVKVDASSNILYPSVVPLILEVSATLKDIVSDDDDQTKISEAKTAPQKFMSVDEDNLLTADPSAVLGRTRLNLGLRICRQEFTLSCQPIARVSATARFDDIYMTINTVRSPDHGHFFAASAAFTRLQASVQHVYSRESTGSFDVDSVFLSLMNSKHLSGTSGLSAILKISPMKVLVNAKQLQDFLLFREIWIPVEIRQASTAPTPTPAISTLQSQTFLVQRYQQVAATGAFAWNATVSIAELDVRIDLGQAIGKSAFMISNFWISSKKNSDWEQNLCLGFDKVGVDSTGRMSGFVALQDFKMRTSIQWPAREMALNQTPLVQGSVSFSQLRIKAAFDYQAFLVADITSLRFLMYNVRNGAKAKADRLVAILDGEAVQVFCTTATASQALALYQAFQRLVQEKRNNYEASLAEIEKFMKRKSIAHSSSPLPKNTLNVVEEDKVAASPISLHTDVIVTLKAVNMGAFPNTFSEHQVFKLEALDAQARFAVTMDKGRVHSSLGLTLGQLRIGLAAVKRVEMPRTVGELSVEDVVSSATGSRGGTILKVPKVEATMQTWQVPNSNHIDYIFKSSFEGKVEVGWNYSRISYIRGMWASHSKALAQKLGKPLPPSAVKITGVPGESNVDRKDGEQQKITAEVNMPQSKYDYTALEPPIIETPQLRDMGEATPPLEWIGLHRDRLPNLTHQIVIVTLLELASEVEDAYAKILGSS